jgi:hypothetical protein
MKSIYNQTHFRITHNGDIRDFSIDTLPSTIPFNQNFSILTAWNPNNQPLSLEENTLCNEQLFETLLESGYLFDEAQGCYECASGESITQRELE